MTTEFSQLKQYVEPTHPAAVYSARQAANTITMAMANIIREVRSLDILDLDRLDSDMRGIVIDIFMRPTSQAR